MGLPRACADLQIRIRGRMNRVIIQQTFHPPVCIGLCGRSLSISAVLIGDSRRFSVASPCGSGGRLTTVGVDCRTKRGARRRGWLQRLDRLWAEEEWHDADESYSLFLRCAYALNFCEDA